MRLPLSWRLVLGLLVVGSAAAPVKAQSYGTEIFNITQPASAGMAGVSLTRPQDSTSALFGNPATMSLYRGTTFTFGGAWVEPSIHVTHDGFVTKDVGGGAFSGRSEAEGSLIGGFAVLQDLEPFMGLPITMGLGLNPGMGGSASFRELPGSAGTTADILALDLTSGLSMRVTDKLSVGATFILSFAIADLALVQSSGATNDYAAGGSFGANYELPMESSIGVYYRTRMRYTFDAMFGIDPPGRNRPTNFRDINMDRPDVVGLGLSNQSLMDGKLLLAFDMMFINWENARLLKSMYKNQWAFGVGSQYQMNRILLRAGYAYNTNPMRDDVGIDVSGFNIGGAAVNYFQATQAPSISQHRITAGTGVRDIIPNVDFDFFVGGQLRAAQDFGTHTSGSYLAWYTGFGLTWHFGGEQAAAPVMVKN